jgi:hypothetical protein
MNIAGLDLATVSGLACMKEGIYTATTFRASTKKKAFLEPDEKKKTLDANHEGEIGRKFEDFLTTWLIDNDIGYVGIEAPLPSNGTRQKTEIDTETNWAGKSIRKVTVDGASLSAIFRIYGLEMIACAVCHRLNIPVIFIHQGTWRKSFLGTGKPSNPKQAAKKECERRGVKISSADSAEAVGVCYHLYLHLNPYGAQEGLFKPKKPLPKTPAQEDALAAANALFKTDGEPSK